MNGLVVSNLKSWLLVGMVFAGIAGCTKTAPPPAIPESGPLTVEEWRQINPNERYDIVYVERLQESDPKLKTKKGWKEFLKAEAEREQKLKMAESAGK